jgi:excisionase family DNA binding protein
MTNSNDTLTTADLGKRLRVHRNTVNRLLRENAFPNAYRICRRWRVPETDVLAFISTQQQKERKTAG